MSLFGDLFGGDDDISNYLQQGQSIADKGEAQGRGDISSYYKQGLGFLNPYMQAGQQGLNAYLGTLGLGDSQGVINRFRQSPGYQFALNQGLNAVNQNAASRGLLGSGANMQNQQRFAQGMADQEYGNFQNRLGQLAGMGQQAAGMGYQGALNTGESLADLGEKYDEQRQNVLGGGVSAQLGQDANSANFLGGLAGGILGFL